ncbi:MAG: DUF763 domain-containing protein [Desulfurococcales archaeon]|nr:DUF763 domain-containing protein [Desulfurococcales archaeon]
MRGIADLPLHDGKVPLWMLRSMERMARSIVKALIELRGHEALIEGLSNPVWFQAFNNIIGMDWDSSGSTTVLTAILKKISWDDDSLGFVVLGGKGSRMREVPAEAEVASKRKDLDVNAENIALFSKIAARVDSSFLQDGYDLYHHVVIVTSNSLLVVQQGMDPGRGLARRYHVRYPRPEEPHSGIAGVKRTALDLSSSKSREVRRVMLEVLSEGPRKALKRFYEAYRVLRGAKPLTSFLSPAQHSWKAPDARALASYYTPVKPSRQLLRNIEDLARFQPSSDLDLLLAPGAGPQVIRALALVADLIYSTPPSREDPVTHPLDPFLYSYAVGGKDRVPYPYNRKTAVKVASILEEVVLNAKISSKEKTAMLMRLRSMVRGTENL